uniref:Uncharacterized protein n=1 Tax=viral metagenome TaxID=1070528 RepID=A0A6C0AQL7_9ZZZZ
MEENNIDYIGSKELVFNINQDEQIYSGGFNVNSIMMKAGMSPIMTLNTDQVGGGSNKVSDLFKNLVVPSWTLSYSNKTGGYKDYGKDPDSDTDNDSDVGDDLHDKLLDLVRESDNKLISKKGGKKTRKQKNIYKKGGTKRNKEKK